MMPAEYQLMIALATVICSGLVSAIVTYKLNTRKDERLLLRQKLEELNLSLIPTVKTWGLPLSYILQLRWEILPMIKQMIR